MRHILVLLLAIGSIPGARVEAQEKTPPSSQQNPVPSPAPAPETEKIEIPGPCLPPPPALPNEPGRMEPPQVKALLHKIWLAEYRINDLLDQVRPEKWKLPEEAGSSFNRTLQTLRAQLGALEDWRGQFDKRPDSIYLGYETYATVNAVLPRLDGVAYSVSQYENASLGAQYSQAENQLFDLQPALEPYLTFLMRNQYQLFLALQTNLGSCQNELGYAMRNQVQPAMPMKNVLPKFIGHPPSSHIKSAAHQSEPTKTAVKPQVEKRPTTKKPMAARGKEGAADRRASK